ncbi:MAG: hypothetical protein HDR88_10910 [Bacteroides sp.]|nr:hypothetical protein [Bacteroides sp.]
MLSGTNEQAHERKPIYITMNQSAPLQVVFCFTFAQLCRYVKVVSTGWQV